jgi:hypothetical protein
MPSNPVPFTQEIAGSIPAGGIPEFPANGRLMRAARLLRHQFAGYQITRRGLAEISSDLPVPRVDLRRYWDHIGVAWLSLFAEASTFAEIERVF